MEFEIIKTEANSSANGMYKYDREIYYMTLDSWCQEAHKYNCLSHGWNNALLKKGSFGYDNLIVSIGYTLINCKDFTNTVENIEIIANMIHLGWIHNYTFWRDYSPWNNTDYKYYKPFDPLGDDRRNECAFLDYKDLSQEEKNKDIILAKFLIGKINEIIEYIV